MLMSRECGTDSAHGAGGPNTHFADGTQTRRAATWSRISSCSQSYRSETKKKKAERDLEALKTKWTYVGEKLATARDHEQAAQKEVDRARKLLGLSNQNPTPEWGDTLVEAVNASMPATAQIVTPQQIEELVKNAVNQTQHALQKEQAAHQERENELP